MITKEQIERVEREFLRESTEALAAARGAERSLESYTYTTDRPYDPSKRQRLLEVFKELDYQAESRAWILSLIRSARFTQVDGSQVSSGDPS